MNREQIIEQIQTLEDLPTLPQVAQRVMALSQDPKTTLRDLKKVIIPDPPLAAKVMMMANSAYFHRRDKAKTLEEALFTIGLNNLVAICASVGVLDAFDKWGSTEIDRKELWKHSVSTAFLSKSLEMRKALDRPGGPDIFLAGLLHDIGWIVFDKVVPELLAAAVQTAKDIKDAEPWSLELERDIIGLDHCEAGAIFLEKWKIPESVISIIAHHHNPDGLDKYGPHAGLVRISSLLVSNRFSLSLPFEELPKGVPHRLKHTEGPEVLAEMEERYVAYIKQADAISNLMVGWL